MVRPICGTTCILCLDFVSTYIYIYACVWLGKRSFSIWLHGLFWHHVHWNPCFIRAVQDWELESLVAFLNLLYSSKILPRETNKMLWSPACNHRFKLKNYYLTLQYGESSLFPWKSVWKVRLLVVSLSSLGSWLWVNFLHLINLGGEVLPLSIGVVFARGLCLINMEWECSSPRSDVQLLLEQGDHEPPSHPLWVY